MIDTVILRLNHPSFTITDYDAFTPSCLGFFTHPYTPFNGSTHLKAIQNASKADKELNNYLPRLTLIKRLGRQGGFAIELKIEFSVPKLIYGNNFKEVEESDFETVIGTLQHKLYQMSISVDCETLRNADICTIHFGKNFCFTDHTTASSLISDIGKVDLTRRLDLNRTHFRNDGRALYYYAKSYSLIFYDKVQDLAQSESKSSEKDNQFNLNLNIFDEIRRKKQCPIEVLRMELRLCDRRKIEQVLKSVNGLEMLSFVNIFKENLAQAVLLDYWDKVHDEVRITALLSRKPLDLLEAVLKLPDLTPQKALSLFAYLELSKTTSERTIHDALSKRFNARTLLRLKQFVKDSADQVTHDRYTAFDQIRRELLEFKPVKRVRIKPLTD